MRSSRRLLAALLAMLLVVTALAGCAKKPETPPATQPPAGEQAAPEPAKKEVPQVLTFNLGEEPPSLDPALSTDITSFTVLNNVFEGLVLTTAEGIKPGMAADWIVSDDQTVYTFKLRDAKWHNGDPVTAEDFAYSWTRALDPRTASEYAYQLYYIKGAEELNSLKTTIDDPTGAKDEEGKPKQVPNPDFEAQFAEAVRNLGVKVVDPKTLEVTLAAPTPYFLGLTSFTTLLPVPKKVAEANPNFALEANTFVGNGPFKLVEWAHKDKIVLEKNPDYWNAASVKLQKIVMPMVVDENTALTMFENDELDSNENIPSDDLPRLVAENKATIGPYIGTYYYLFNHTRPPFDDVQVRKALSMAIDRKAIVENVTQGGQAPALAYVPGGFLNPETGKDFRTEGGDWFTEDLAEAKRLLADAGYPDGKSFPAFTLLYNTSEGHKKIAEAIQAMWKTNLGIGDVTLQNQDWAVYLDTRAQLNYDVARAGWIGDYLDPMTFIDMWISTSGNNDTGWSNAEYDQLIQTAKTTGDQAVRFDAMHKAEELLKRDVVVMPIYFYTQIWQDQPWVKNIFRSALGITDFRGTYIEEH